MGHVLHCSSNSVKYIVKRGANVNSKVSKGKFKGMTPLQFLNEMENCSESNTISSFLKKNGAISNINMSQ